MKIINYIIYLLLFIAAFLVFSCSKTKVKPNNIKIVRFGNVSDKKYTDSFPFVTGQYRRYWVLWSHDTTCPPTNPNCGYAEWKRVKFSCYDTLFRNRYPERLADTSFIPDYPY